jgi:hypothetical protein
MQVTVFTMRRDLGVYRVAILGLQAPEGQQNSENNGIFAVERNLLP